MAWLGEGLSSLSNLKGQITNFSKEFLSDGIVEDNVTPSTDLDIANAKCVQLQELLNSKEAEISILRKQNSELQKAVVEFRAKPNDSGKNHEGPEEKEEDEFFWDPPRSSGNRQQPDNSKLLQDQLDQAALRIKDLESELNRLQTLNSSNVKDTVAAAAAAATTAIYKEEGPSQKTELLRAKQDVMNRIIQIGEKSREVERNTRRLQQDELTLVSDFRRAISKLASPEQYDLIKSALLALENENQESRKNQDKEKSDSGGFDVEGKNEREVELQKRIGELEEENRGLSANIEELDKQHAESIERVLLLKEELQKKHHSLQSAYEHLYIEYNQAQGKIESLQNQPAVLSKSSTKESSDSSVQTSNVPKEDKQIEVCSTNSDKATEIDFSTDKNDVDHHLNSELDKVRQILKDLAPANLDNEETLFTKLAKNYVELNAKQENLDRQFHDQNRELKETQEIRNSMQIECDDMQANIESLLLEIQHLKKNLPSIPEASEERVASLETETESLQEEIRTLRKSNSKMSNELKALKTAIKEVGANIDLARVDVILEEKSKQRLPNDPDELLQKTLEENTALRRRIDVLESELRVSMERCKGLDENIELIEELKLDLENARRELKIALSNGKRLENSLAMLQETKNEVDADNEVLVREKEQLEADLKLLRESDLKKDDGEALAELRDKLKKMKEEKDDLEYDIKNMRNELDKTLEDLEESKAQTVHLHGDNERLIKENNKLLDQFSETQNESLDKIELLNTEMTLLQQELEYCKNELENAIKNMGDMEEKMSTLENDNQNLKEQLIKAKNVESENQILLKQVEENLTQKNLNHSKEDLEIALQRLKELENKVLICENENQRLKNELTKMEQIEYENEKLNEEVEIKTQEIYDKEKEFTAIKNKLQIVENQIITLQKEKEIAFLKVKEFEFLVEENENIRKETKELERQLCQEKQGKEKENKFQKEITTEIKNLSEKSKESITEEISEISIKSNAEISQLLIELDEKSKEIENLKKTIAKDKESALMARETVENLSQLISAKDSDLSKMKMAYDALMKEKDELIKLIQEKHAESLQYHSELQRLTQLLNEQNTNLQRLISEKEANFTALQEKETQLLWSQNELKVLKQRLQNVEETTNHAEHCSIPDHSLLNKQVSMLEEKNKALESAVLQDQTNIRYLQEQLTEAQSKEALSLKEVERLRTHLMEMETNYTEEQLQSEEIQRTLEARLVQAEEKLKNSSTMYTSVSVRANQQVETLQQQLALMVQQRDDLQNKISSAEDKVLSYSASLTNLQLVLEQFQRDKEKDIQAATEKIRAQLEESYKKQEDLQNDISILKEQLAEAKECVRAASRLTEQLEKKSERIEQLNQEVNRLTELVNTADQRVQEAFKSSEGKVDRSLIKNLLLGYISSPPGDKTSVLRVFANVLDFNEVEREKSGLNSSSAKNSWFSSMVNNNGSNPNKDQEASLSSAFIKFLENESQPKPQLPALPISNSSLNRPGHSRQHSSSSTQSALLLSNVTLPTFPDFVPARNTGSILKEVLKDS